MAELGRADIEARWLAHSLRFWNSLCAQPRDGLHYQLLLDAQSEVLVAGTRNWVWGLRQACRRVGFELPLSLQRARPVDVLHVMDLQAAQQQRAWEALSVCPRTCQSEGAAKCTYWRWFSRTPQQQERLGIFRQRHSARRIGIYLRFRLGCSDLPVVMGRRDGTARHMRRCQRCSDAAVGDERHMVFECPAVQHIRDQHSDLFWVGQSMRDFVNQANQVEVMNFIVAYFDSSQTV